MADCLPSEVDESNVRRSDSTAKSGGITQSARSAIKCQILEITSLSNVNLVLRFGESWG